MERHLAGPHHHPAFGASRAGRLSQAGSTSATGHLWSTAYWLTMSRLPAHTGVFGSHSCQDEFAFTTRPRRTATRPGLPAPDSSVLCASRFARARAAAGIWKAEDNATGLEG